MASWRFLRRWSDAEIAAALARARTLPLNFDPHRLRGPRHGWNLAASRARIATEAAGPPPPGGTFDRLWSAIRAFEHSDPRIVVAHFQPDERFEGRVQLLELRAVGLGFLCPSRIAASNFTQDRRRTRRWFALDTLQGHIERGREYFVLEKNHASGTIRFRILASWRLGDFPNRWSRLGFLLVGRRYQRAWHRLAHLRLRHMAAEHRRRMAPEEMELTHRGTFLPAEPVQLFAQRGLGRRYVDVEGEGEDVRSDELWSAIGLGALSGVRSMAGPSSVLHTFSGRGAAPRRLATLASVFALAELAADKLPFLPARTHPASLAGRAASGAYVGAASRRRAGDKLPLALLGAASALAAAHASFLLRRRAIRRSPRLGWLVALAEDALSVGASRWLTRNHLPAAAG